MSRLQEIEKELSSINETIFQELCDSFLAIRNPNYSAFSRTGSQSGKQKTIKGTPDTFLLLPNGKYIFIEYSTNITAGLSKLEDDIKKCIDSTKTGILINQIEEIIICINFNLKSAEIQILANLLSITHIVLTVYTLDSLAIELHLQHRDLTHQYLGLVLDTGQIVSIEKFITEYNRVSKGISTPLDNTFLHRELELKELKKSIYLEDFIILTGAPGIGKTKLALEAITSFLHENSSFLAYCVSYKNHTLLDDLYQYFKLERDYLLFVDDANRIDAFSQIIGFFKSSRKGKLKIIITVRDYAFQDINLLCQEFSPKRIDIFKLSDGQIIDIIEARPFGILNPLFQIEIVRISDGNPRLAIMTALLAKAEQNINALSDVSQLFEKYFSTFIKDDGEFANELNIKCLGLIAFFYTIPYKNKEISVSVLNNFGLEYLEFIDSIDKLDKLELVELQYEHVKIPEQNLSTYFFYKTFIKDNLLSFQILLEKYFDVYSRRFRDCVIPANNTFGHQNVMDKLKPDLQNYWRLIESDDEKAFKFLIMFWYYLRSEALEFVFKKVELLPTIEVLTYEMSYDDSVFSFQKNEILDLLGEFFIFPDDLKDVLELAFEYVRKSPKHLPELIHKIRDQLTFDDNDEKYSFLRQTILFELLLNGLNKSDELYSKVFFELSKTFLLFKFHHTKGGRNHSFTYYDYPIPNFNVIQEFRKRIWNALASKFSKYPIDSFILLQNYANATPNSIYEIMEIDIEYVVNIIDEHLSRESFEHCRYVQNQIRLCKHKSIFHPAFLLLSQKFTNSIYELFLKIDWDRQRDKDYYEFEDYNEYEKLKEAEIRKTFVFNSLADIKSFYDVFFLLKNLSKNDWSYTRTIEYVIDENFLINFELGCKILLFIIENENEIGYVPKSVFKNQLKTEENANRIWFIIKSKEFKLKSLWEFSFYDYLSDSLINADYVQALLNTVTNIKDSSLIYFDSFQRFLMFEPNLFKIILERITEKNETEEIQLQVWSDFFSNHFDKLGDDIKFIERAYLQQDKIQSYFDSEGKGFLNIIMKDPNFLIEYINNIYSRNRIAHTEDYRNMEFVWQVADIEPILKDVFDLVIEKDPYYGILEHFCNSFFRNLQGELKEKASKFLLEYCRISSSDPNKMNVIVDIVRHSITELFESILLLFLSLNQNVEVFSEIWWRGNGGTYWGDTILGDIEASEWKNILTIIEKSQVGIKLIPIKRYINDQVDASLKSGDSERQRRFLER